ncbi:MULTISPECIES: mercuric transporter MerT family protein [Azospirillum]|uniref:Mercuric transport protein MerT n=1 Tax=Azospirillum brasilense TaxID=192 RepID=A0A6L3B1B8_AZOBR|nr:mercuric transporter MerT family protein [Azospirillum brasilense]KAA0686114.1 mercury transporter MerT [Azospirillum brasilense]
MPETSVPAARHAQQRERSARDLPPGLLAVGGLLGAFGASSCCVLPLVFFSLGVSGAWIGNLTTLAPYQPLFVAAALGCLGAGLWRVYRRPPACDGPACTRPAPNRLVKAALWGAAVLVGVALAFPYTAPLLLS